MNFYFITLFLFLLVSIRASPVGYEDQTTPTDNREQEEEPTHPTFTGLNQRVQRLDAPIERIEIRLIDDNTTRVVPEETRRTPHNDEVNRAGAGKDEIVNTITTEPPYEHEPDQDPSPTPTSSDDEMYKKVEYEVQPTSSPEPMVVGEDPSYFSTVSSENKASAEAKAWISVSVSTTIPKFDGDIDEDDLPPAPVAEDTENEEPEEECLANKEKLTDEVIEKLQAETTTYYRLVRQRNEQQKEFCGGGAAHDVDSDMYRRCSNWRAEKLVYYYKLMRKTYCQVDNWPNSPKIKKTYGEYLNLFGTFYAFQK